MPTTIGSLRRRLLTPSLAKVSFAGRGFPVTPSERTRRLEAVPQAVICGFEWGIDTRDQGELECRLNLVEPEMRGFAYEGATMALTVLDSFGGGKRTRDFLTGPGSPHLLLAYIGIGFAMARLPRPLWKKVLPELPESPFHPTMSWLAVDGYGFDLAYFGTERWVERQEVPKPYPWQGFPDYFPRAFDQGVGRALWFVHGGRPAAAAAAVAGFDEHRQADLWSGVGLAATFAGGCAPEGLTALRRAAGARADSLALGAVFAVRARVLAGFVPEHTGPAITTLSGCSVDEAVTLADSTSVAPGGRGEHPDYEIWRERIRTHFQK